MATINIYEQIAPKRQVIKASGKINEILPEFDFNNSIILIGGHRVAPDTEVFDDDVVFIRRLPSSAVAIAVTSIVLTVVSAAVSVGVGIYAAVQQQRLQDALNDAQKQSKESNSDIDKLPFLKGARNVLALGKSVPFVMGKMFFTPYKILSGHFSLSGDNGENQYYNVPLSLGWNNQVIESVSIGDVKIKNFNDTSPQSGTYSMDSGNVYYDADNSIEIKQSGEFSSSNFNRKIVTQTYGTELKHDNGASSEPVIKQCPENTRSVDVEVQFDALRKMNDDGAWVPQSVGLSVKWSNDNGSSWHEFAEFRHSERAVHHYEGMAYTWVYNIPRGTASLNQLSNTFLRLLYNSTRVDAGYIGTVTMDGLPGTYTAAMYPYINDLPPKNLWFENIVGHTLYDYDSVNKVMKFVTHYAYDVEEYSIVTSNTITHNTGRTCRFIAHRDFSAAECFGKQILIRVERTTEKAAKNSQETMYLGYIQAECYDAKKSSASTLVTAKPLDDFLTGKTTRIGIRMKATDSTKDELDNINVVTCGCARTWNGTAWSTTESPTRNPASWILKVLQADFHEASKYSDDEIDLDSFGALYEFCEEESLFCDGVVTQGTKKSDLIGKILSECFSSLILNKEGKLEVCTDHEEQNPVALINSQNIKSLKVSKSLERTVDGKKVTFVNRSNWQTDTMYVMRDGTTAKGQGKTCSEIALNFVTTPEHGWKVAQRGLLKEYLQPREVIVKTGKEGDFYPLYSVVKVQLPQMRIGACSTTLHDINFSQRVIVIADHPVLEAEKNYGLIVSGVTDSGCVEYDIPVYVEEDGATNILHVDEDWDMTQIESGSWSYGNICSLGLLDDDGGFSKVVNLMKIEDFRSSNDGVELTLVDYNPDLYRWEHGTPIPEFKSNLTPKSEVPGSSSVSMEDVYSAISEATSQIQSEAGSWSFPDYPDVTAVAYENYIELSYTYSDAKKAYTYNTITQVEWRLTPPEGNQRTVILPGNGRYVFNRSTDGFPERSEIQEWKVVAVLTNQFGKVCECPAINVSASKYGTWQLTAAKCLVRVNDRTVTLIPSLSERSDGLESYGDIRYKISVRKPGYDTDGIFFCPGTNSDPYPSINSEGVIVSSNENNYKDTSSAVAYTVSEGVYTQTMPLTGQGSNDMKDTLYQFKIVAFNESGNESSAVTVNATVLVTSIRDIVKANETAKTAYISQLSAISVNIGTISDGAFGGGDNMWDLSSFVDDLGNRHYKGKFRIGGAGQYLEVVPKLHTGEMIPYDYELNFKVGKFTLTSEASSINGELVIQSDDNSLDRAVLTPSGIMFQHRYNTESAWADTAAQDVNGVLTNQVHSDDGKMIISSQTVEQRRAQGTDIGRVLLTDSGRVYHFDTNELDNKGESILTITDAEGTERKLFGFGDSDLDGIDFTPAILTVAPYSSVGKALYGQYSLEFDILQADTFTVDLWIKYIYAENQILLKLVNSICELILAVMNKEAFYNDFEEGDTPYNIETAETLLFQKLTENDEPYFADDYNGGKLATESVYNTIADEEFNSDWVYYWFDANSATRNGGYRVASVTFANYDELVHSGLYKKTCVYNAPKDPDTFVRVKYIDGTTYEYSLSAMGIQFNEGEWLHCGIVQNAEKFGFYLNENPFLFDRTPGARDIHFTLNGNKKSFILDELMIDPTVFEPITDFAEATLKRIPWGGLSKDEDWFILMAKDTSKIKTNIFDSDAFKNAVRRVIAE